MTPREAAALVVLAALLAYAGFWLPRRTGTLIAELRDRIERDPDARAEFYLDYLYVAAAGTAVFAAAVWAGGAGFAAAGVAWPPAAAARLVPAVITGGTAFALVYYLARAIGGQRDPAAFDEAAQYARVEILIPRTRRERRLWPAVSLAAGVLEELWFRGLFVLYAARLAGISPWWLLVPMALAFGNGHRYQGWVGVVTTTAIGIALGIVTIGTGSLWPAIAAHAAFDVRLMFVRPPAPAAQAPAQGSAPLPPPPA